MKLSIALIILFSLSLAQAQNSEIDKAIADYKKVSDKNSTNKTESEKLDELEAQKNQSVSTEVKTEIKENKTEKTTEDKKTVMVEKNVNKLSKEETEMLKRRFQSLVKPIKDRPDLLENESASKVYDPAPVHYRKTPLQKEESVRESFQLERDSQLILHQYISYKDAFTVQICYTNGLSLTFDDTVETTIQSAIADDQDYLGAIVAENKRGAYIHLKQPVPEGSYWETAVRLVRKSDDKTYLINVIARSCPKAELNPFPRVIYLKDKDNSQPVIGRKNNVNTPQDKILNLSSGFPKTNSKRVRVYDMVASSGSEWVVFGIEIQMPNGVKETKDLSKLQFFFLDNFQINDISAKIEFLPIPSEVRTKYVGVSTLRFKATVNINKQYIMNDRYLHFMLLDQDEKSYQYTRIDVLPYFKSLIKRGMDL